ncbi:MAG: hypothetical protein IJD92_04530 [Bacilli bacterium]|nr:hypothetical protein [Bacilli bacterium]
MKKYLVILCLFLFTCGCGKSGNDNVINKFKDKINDSNSYLLKGTMDIVSNEDTFNYDIESSKSKNDYYKVSLINKTNDHEQVILKNKDGVYVVTPDLNKSFKFQSDWPNNGSQSYLLDVLVNDVVNDNNVYVGKEDKVNYIQCRVNYPNNNALYSEKIYLDDDYNVKKVLVLDQEGNVKITLNVNSIEYKPKFNDEYFSLESLITVPEEEQNIDDIKDKEETDNNQNNVSSSEDTENTSNILDEIIYPLYVPQNTSLSTQDTINTDNGNRAILTFAGDSPFVLVEEVSQRYDEMEIIPVNGEPLIMSDCIGALSSNSLYWTSGGVDYYLSSTSLDGEELMTIAEGLTGTSIIVSGEK